MAENLCNLNADMGEGWGVWQIADDAGLLELVNSANIACGLHGGDYNIMAQLMAAAAEKGVTIGAHPGFFDLHGFGRRALPVSEAEAERLLAYQIGAALGIAALVGAKVSHVKVHGALNNMACADRGLSDALVRAVRAVDESLVFLAPSLSEMAAAGRAGGLAVVDEVFADRRYMPDGQLAPRSRPDALITDAAKSLGQIERIIRQGEVVCVDGSVLQLPGRSVCVHGDGAQALALARAVRDGLVAASIKLVPLPEIV
jgi:UPF0271 protein